MNLTELINAVYVETFRPDLINQTKQAVKSSVLKLHMIDFFWKDIKEQKILFDKEGYLQSYDTSLLTRFRAVSYMRKHNECLGGASFANPPYVSPTLFGGYTPGYEMWEKENYLSLITPDNIFDDYGCMRQDVYYGAGSLLQIRSSTCIKNALFGFYQFPDTSDESFSSWIATQQPYAIVYDAAGAILGKIGKSEAAQKYTYTDPMRPENNGLATVQISILKQQNVIVQGS